MTETARLRVLLAEIRTIAIVGLSANLSRPSNEVAGFLAARGFTCFGVNPGLAGQRVRDIPVVARLADVPTAIDMVDIFRESAAVEGLVEETLNLRARPKLLWMQLGVIDPAAKQRAEAAGLSVVMDHCPKLVLAGT